MTKLVFISLILSSIALCNTASSQDKFKAGPIFQKFGKHAAVAVTKPLDKNVQFKIAFDVGERSGDDILNRRFNTLARFINMHVAKGIPLKNIELALVVHGKAGFDLLTASAYKKQFSTTNPTADLVEELLSNNVKIYLCGQSAAYYDIDNEDLIDNVQMALSAMTAHALLSQQGFTHNPF